jgi:hypothetical protein
MSLSVDSWKIFFDWVSVVLIALTVVSGAGAVITGRIINDRQAREVAILQKEAVDAKTNYAGLEKEATEAKAKYVLLEKDSAETKIRLSRQLERTANAEGALLKLKAQTEPRRVTQEQRARFLASYRLPSGLRPLIAIIPKGNVPDAPDFAGDLVSLFREAGYLVDDSSLGSVNMIGGVGRSITIAAGTQRVKEAKDLATALVSAGIAKPPVELASSESPITLVLYVGERPN